MLLIYWTDMKPKVDFYIFKYNNFKGICITFLINGYVLYIDTSVGKKRNINLYVKWAFDI